MSHSALLSHLSGIAYRAQNDRDWTMIFVSEGCLALTGCQSAALIDNITIAWAQPIHPAERDEM